MTTKRCYITFPFIGRWTSAFYWLLLPVLLSYFSKSQIFDLDNLNYWTPLLHYVNWPVNNIAPTFKISILKTCLSDILFFYNRILFYVNWLRCYLLIKFILWHDFLILSKYSYKHIEDNIGLNKKQNNLLKEITKLWMGESYKKSTSWWFIQNSTTLKFRVILISTTILIAADSWLP